jgi:hypothetical protein
MVDDAEILASLPRLHDDIAEMSEVVARNIARVPGLAHRALYMLLRQDLGRRLLQARAE